MRMLNRYVSVGIYIFGFVLVYKGQHINASRLGFLIVTATALYNIMAYVYNYIQKRKKEKATEYDDL